MRWQSMTWGFPSMLKGPWSLQILFDTGEAPNIQKVFAENRNDKKHSPGSPLIQIPSNTQPALFDYMSSRYNASAHQRRLNRNRPGQDMRWNWWNSPAVDKSCGGNWDLFIHLCLLGWWSHLITGHQTLLSGRLSPLKNNGISHRRLHFPALVSHGAMVQFGPVTWFTAPDSMGIHGWIAVPRTTTHW